MWSIAKAQLFQLKKNRLLYIVFISLLAFQSMLVVMFMLMSQFEQINDPTMGGFLALQLPLSTNFSLMFSLVAAAIICCADFSDKTINYEPMNGHVRAHSYFGRALVSVTVGIIGFYILTFLPPCILAVINGWGTGLNPVDFLIRALLMSLPVIRLLCEFVFLAFAVKNMYIAMLCGFIMLTGTGALAGISSSSSPFLALTSLNLFTRITTRATYGLMGNIYFIYDADIDITQTAAVAAASVFGAALFLFLGCVLFKNDDLN